VNRLQLMHLISMHIVTVMLTMKQVEGQGLAQQDQCLGRQGKASKVVSSICCGAGGPVGIFSSSVNGQP